MTMSFYAADRVDNKLFGNVTLTQPATLYFGLSTTTPARDGSNVTEPNGSTGYARVALSNGDKTNFTTASGTGSVTTLTAVTFPESTASQGVLTYGVIYDALTSGNLWFYDVLTPSRTVDINTTLYYSAGALTFNVT